jgi:2-desacetyl-2-hydroxyethyl bacteriochlorophyllide A dehydrogenase
MVESNYWVWTAKETAELKSETLPAPAPDEVLVKTRFTAVSPGTEMALYMMTHVGFPDPNNKYAKYPHRGGYLNVGVVEAAGDKVAADWPAGTWVYSAAGHCQYSLRKPLADVWSAASKLPECLRGPEAALLGMVRIGYAASYVAPALIGETVAVLGAGLVGNFAAQIYNAAAANVVVVERDEFRRGIAKKCGLATVASVDDVARFFGTQPRTVVEATGVPQLSVEAMKLAARKGRAIILSSPRGEAPVNFYSQIHQKCISVIGAHANVIDDANAAQNLVISLAAQGKIQLVPCVTHIESWHDAPAIWNTYARGPEYRLGTVFDWER